MGENKQKIGRRSRTKVVKVPGIEILQTGFKEGAEWMLGKAVNWLQDHVNDYLFDDGTPERPWLKCKSEMFDDFKKAMEE